jgi:hypothetical protein
MPCFVFNRWTTGVSVVKIFLELTKSCKNSTNRWLNITPTTKDKNQVWWCVSKPWSMDMKMLFVQIFCDNFSTSFLSSTMQITYGQSWSQPTKFSLFELKQIWVKSFLRWKQAYNFKKISVLFFAMKITSGQSWNQPNHVSVVIYILQASTGIWFDHWDIQIEQF